MPGCRNVIRISISHWRPNRDSAPVMIDRPFSILQVLPKLDTGGAERVAIEICEAIQDSGHKALIACEGGPLTNAALRTGAEIITLPLDTKSPLALHRNARRLQNLIRDR